MGSCCTQENNFEQEITIQDYYKKIADPNEILNLNYVSTLQDFQNIKVLDTHKVLTVNYSNKFKEDNVISYCTDALI